MDIDQVTKDLLSLAHCLADPATANYIVNNPPEPRVTNQIQLAISNLKNLISTTLLADYPNKTSVFLHNHNFSLINPPQRPLIETLTLAATSGKYSFEFSCKPFPQFKSEETAELFTKVFPKDHLNLGNKSGKSNMDAEQDALTDFISKHREDHKHADNHSHHPLSTISLSTLATLNLTNAGTITLSINQNTSTVCDNCPVGYTCGDNRYLRVGSGLGVIEVENGQYWDVWYINSEGHLICCRFAKKEIEELRRCSAEKKQSNVSIYGFFEGLTENEALRLDYLNNPEKIIKKDELNDAEIRNMDPIDRYLYHVNRCKKDYGKVLDNPSNSAGVYVFDNKIYILTTEGALSVYCKDQTMEDSHPSIDPITAVFTPSDYTLTTAVTVPLELLSYTYTSMTVRMGRTILAGWRQGDNPACVFILLDERMGMLAWDICASTVPVSALWLFIYALHPVILAIDYTGHIIHLRIDYSPRGYSLVRICGCYDHIDKTRAQCEKQKNMKEEKPPKEEEEEYNNSVLMDLFG